MGKLNQSVKELVIRRKKLLLERRECQNILGRIKYEELSKRSPFYKIEPLRNRDSATVNLREKAIENRPSLVELDLKEANTEMASLFYKYPARGILFYLYHSIVK